MSVNIIYEYVHGWETMLERLALHTTGSIEKNYRINVNFEFFYPYQVRSEIKNKTYDFFISHIGRVIDDEPCPTKDAPLSVYRRAKDIKNLSPQTITVAESEKFGTVTGKEILCWFDDWSKPVLKDGGAPLITLLRKNGHLPEEEKIRW